MTPRIGITTSYQDGEQRLAHAYVRAVADAGGLPLIVPMLDSPAHVAALFEALDGLVVTGGPAVTGGLVGDVPEDLAPCPPLRTNADVPLLDAFLASDKPILGICYGMQLLNARLGGTLYADVERQQPGSAVHARQRGGTTHPAVAEPGTVFAALFGVEPLHVNTRHVQAIATVANGLRLSATAPDGVVEAIESADGRLVGVQFHPEQMGPDMQPLFTHLVEQARSARLSPLLT